MGFVKGSVSFTPYRVIRQTVCDLEYILAALNAGKIGTIDIDLGNDHACGFATFEDPLSTDFRIDNFLFEDLVLFSFRMDSLDIPAETLRLHVQRHIQERLSSSRRQKMPREEREEIVNVVKLDLLRRAIPKSKAVDVIWQMGTGTLLFASNSTKLNQAFLIRFMEHFDINLMRMNAVGIIESRLEELVRNDVYHLLPTSFLLSGGNFIAGQDDEDKEVQE